MSTASMSSALNTPRRILQNLRRTRTQKITRLFTTRLKLVKVEFVGEDHPAMSRVGTFIFYGPLLVIGYAFTLASVAWLLAPGIGWAGTLFLMGLGHLALGAWGVRRGRLMDAAQNYDVMDYECETPHMASDPASRELSPALAHLPRP